MIIIVLSGCNFENGSPKAEQSFMAAKNTGGETRDSVVFKNAAFANNEKPIAFIDKKYQNQKPIASLANLPVYTDSSVSFTLKKPTNVHIYAVGEMINALAKVSRQYYLGNDDIEIYFDLKNNKTAFNKKQDDRQYIFTWVEDYIGGLNSQKRQVIFKKEFDSVHYKVTFLLTFPWKELGYIDPVMNEKIGFDMAVSDNDDGLRQKGKIAWSSSSDSMTMNTAGYGTMILDSGENKLAQPGTIFSYYKPIEKFMWAAIQPTEVTKVIAGQVKDKRDCSALIRSCWDKKNLYFLIEVTDYVTFYNQRYITQEKRKTLQTFFDYGLIIDENGCLIWQMNALNATHAGGAVKNQKIDTTIWLKAGRYFLRYISDESHAYNNWDDDPPRTPFYGIILYDAGLKK